MSKKLLNESTIRRFGALANLNPNATSNFIQGLDEEEEEVEGFEVTDTEELPGGEELELDADLELDEPAPEATDADALVKGLIDAVAEWAMAQGVSISVEGGDEEAALDDLGDAELDLGDAEADLGDAELDLGDAEADLGDAEADLGLEEIIAKALAEAGEKEEEVIQEEDTDTKDTDADDDDAVIKEVTKRVKARIAELYATKQA
jgi:exosome complex component RRP41